MPDWRAITAEHLAGLRLPDARREQVLQELTEHLEDEFTMLCERLPEEEARQRVLNLLAESQGLIQEIGSAEKENAMNQSTRALWLPGLVMLAVYSLLAVALGAYVAQTGPRVGPQSVLAAGMMVFLTMGAVGAWWARSNGATRGQRVIVSIFPVLMPLAGLLVVGPVYALLQGRALFPPHWGGEVLNFVIKGVAIPAAGLLLGALPFLGNGASTRHQVVS